MSESSSLIATLIASIFFVTGLLGCILPVIPGPLLVWLGVLIHKLWVPEQSVSWTFVAIAAGLALLTQILDWLCAWWGARKFGGTWRGGIGAAVGAIIGIFLPPPLLWIIVGPIIGATVGEIWGGFSWQKAGKAGLGTVFGGLVAYVVRFGITCGLILAFFLAIG